MTMLIFDRDTRVRLADSHAEAVAEARLRIAAGAAHGAWVATTTRDKGVVEAVGSYRGLSPWRLVTLHGELVR